MAKVLPSIDAGCRDFIGRQRIFFAASAAPGAHVNLSPRGTDLFVVLDEVTVAWLDKTGSGAETAAHLKADGRLTVMFCAFDGPPNILRLYGRGEILRRESEAYHDLLTTAFGGVEPPGARQIVRLHVDRVQTSCGYGVPPVRLSRRAAVARQLGPFEGRGRARGLSAGEEHDQHRRPAHGTFRRRVSAGSARRVGGDGSRGKARIALSVAFVPGGGAVPLRPAIPGR